MVIATVLVQISTIFTCSILPYKKACMTRLPFRSYLYPKKVQKVNILVQGAQNLSFSFHSLIFSNRMSFFIENLNRVLCVFCWTQALLRSLESWWSVTCTLKPCNGRMGLFGVEQGNWWRASGKRKIDFFPARAICVNNIFFTLKLKWIALCLLRYRKEPLWPVPDSERFFEEWEI